MTVPHHPVTGGSRSQLLAATVAAVLSLAAAPTQASPSQGVITSGQGSIQQHSPGVTQIDQASHSLGIDWQTFDIAAGERVQFNQPSANSVAINRILGQDPSQIHGSLSANGQVFLLNPNGIIFGATAQVNVGSLVASTLDLTSSDGHGRYSFAAGERAGAIVNAGRIVAAPGGSVSLLGSSVLNQGLIVANYGTVNLGAGRAATLDFTGDGLVRFEVDGALLEAAPHAAVHNQGQIDADGGQVLLTASQARDVLSQAVNNQGVIRAARIDNSGGRIRLVGTGGRVEHSGVLDASGSAGGEVQVLGDQVSVTGSALIDASGVNGGGSVLVGGSFRGADTDIINAQRTEVERGAVLRADATVQGDGGQVVVWSDGTTVFDGTIQARALGSGGDGGMAEVSGREHLRITGHAELRSAQGRAGTLLLDPGSITIIAGADEAPPADFDVIHDAWIETQLATSSLHIQTDTSQNDAAEHLRVEAGASIVWNTANALTLQGDDSVTLATGSHIESTGGGTLHLLTNGAVSLQGTVLLNGDLTVGAGADITQTAALNVAGTAAFNTAAGNSILLGHADNQFGAVLLGSHDGSPLQNVSIHNRSALTLGGLHLTGDLLASTGGQLTQTGALITGGAASFTAGAGTSLNLGNAGNDFGDAVSFASAGVTPLQDITVHSQSQLQLGTLALAGNLLASTSGQLTQSGAAGVGGSAGFTAGVGQSIVLDQAGNQFSGAVSFASAGAGALQNVSISSASSLQLTGGELAGDLQVHSMGAVTQTGALRVAGAAAFFGGAGESVTLTQVGNVFSGGVGFAGWNGGSLQNVDIRSGAGLQLRASTLSGNLTATTAGALTQSGALVVGGDTQFIAGQGQSLVLDDLGNAFGGTVSLASNGPQALQDVTLFSTSSLSIAPLQIDGDLAASTAGSLTQTGAWVIGGDAVLTAGAGQSIALQHHDNLIAGTLGFNAADGGLLRDVGIRNVAALDLAAMSLSGNLVASTDGALTQSGALQVAGNAEFIAGADQSITMVEADNAFAGAVSFAASSGELQDVSIHNSVDLDLGELTLTGDLQARSASSLTQSGALQIGGNASFTAAEGEAILLANAGNRFGGTVSFNAVSGRLQDVAIHNSASLDLGALSITGDLQASSGSSLTQSGALQIEGDAAFTAAAGESIQMLHSGNDFGGAVSFNAAGSGLLQHVAINDSSALDLGALRLSGNLQAQSAGALTQSGALQVAGNAIFRTAAGQSITLTDTGNAFGGTVTLAALGAGNLRDVSLHSTSSLVLQSLRLDGDLHASTLGELTQTGFLNIAGSSRFTAGDGESIELSHSGNVFGGSVAFDALPGSTLQDVTVRSASALELQGLILNGDLQVTAGGAITQSDAMTVAGVARFRTLNNAGAAIELDAANDFAEVHAAVRNSANTADAAADITLHDSGDVLLGDLSTAAGNSITVQTSGSIAGRSGSVVRTGSLALSAGDDIGSSGQALAVALTNGQLVAEAGGNVHLQDTAGVGSTLGIQRVVAGGDVDLRSDASLRVATIDAVGGVRLHAGGDLLRADAAATITAGDALHLQAGGGIGSAADRLQLQAESVSAKALSGGIHLQQLQGDLRVAQLDAAGAISLQADDGAILAAASGDGVIASASGGVALQARDGLGRLDDFDARQGEALQIDSHGHALAAAVGTDADVYLQIAPGSGFSSGNFSGGGTGRLLLESAGDLVLAGAGSTVDGFAAVALSADGVLQLSGLQEAFSNGAPADLRLRGAVDIDAPGREVAVDADALQLESGGAGGDLALRGRVARLDASIGGGAGLTVNNTGILTVGQVTAQGNVSLVAQQILADAAAGSGITANAIHLEALQGIGSAGQRVRTTAQSLAVHSGGDSFIAHQGEVQLSGQVEHALDVAATGDITVADTLRAGQSLTLSAGQDADGGMPAVSGDIRLDGVASTAGTAVLHARGGGVIEDAGIGNHLVADEVALIAGRVGTQANALSMHANTLAARVDAGLHIEAADNLQLRAVTASQASIAAAGRLDDGGGSAPALTADRARLSAAMIGSAGQALRTQVTTLDAAVSNGAIHIEQTGDIRLGRIDAGVNSIELVADGAISQEVGGSIQGSHLRLSGHALGGEGNAALQTKVESLDAHASAGGIHVNEADDLQLRSITAPGQAVVLTAGGMLVDDGNATTVIQGGRVSLQASAIGSSDAHLGTAADALTIRATDGGIYVAERDAVTLVDVRAEGAGQEVVMSTANDGDMTVQRLVTQGGAVSLTAGGRGSLNVTGTLESNNGLVNLISGDVLAIPGLNTGAGRAVLHTVNDVTVGTISGSSILIISDTGSVHLVSANAGNGTVTIEARNGTINDGDAISLTAGHASLTARAIGSADNPLDVAVERLSVQATEGGVFITDTDALELADISARGPVRIDVAGRLHQTGALSSGGDLALTARSIDMSELAMSQAVGDITYVAHGGDINLSSITASGGRVLVIAANEVFSVLGGATAVANLTGHAVEVRAGGLLDGSGRIGTVTAPLSIATHAAAGAVFLIVPAVNGIQTTTPQLSYAGSTSSLLLKGYSGSSGALLLDTATAFTADTVLLHGESIVPLRNGRVAVNSDSLSAAKQALSSGVIARVNIDWAAFDPEVSLFGTLDAAVRLPNDQIDELP